MKSKKSTGKVSVRRRKLQCGREFLFGRSVVGHALFGEPQVIVRDRVCGIELQKATEVVAGRARVTALQRHEAARIERARRLRGDADKTVGDGTRVAQISAREIDRDQVGHGG